MEIAGRTGQLSDELRKHAANLSFIAYEENQGKDLESQLVQTIGEIEALRNRLRNEENFYLEVLTNERRKQHDDRHERPEP